MILNPMNPLRLVNLQALQAAYDHIVAELEQLGFYDDRLYQVDVYLVPVSWAYGFQRYGGDSSINIPSVSGSHLLDVFRGDRTDLCDVLRHEFGHAVADTHRGLFRSLRFSSVFDGSHESDESSEYDPEKHVTAYAATKPSEDFAEVFWLFVKYAGKVPWHYDKPSIRKKWIFCEALRKAIINGQRRW